jgi:hypothetical protein
MALSKTFYYLDTLGWWLDNYVPAEQVMAVLLALVVFFGFTWVVFEARYAAAVQRENEPTSGSQKKAYSRIE